MMNFEVVETKQENAKIKVVGVGGAVRAGAALRAGGGRALG